MVVDIIFFSCALKIMILTSSLCVFDMKHFVSKEYVKCNSAQCFADLSVILWLWLMQKAGAVRQELAKLKKQAA